MASAAFSAAGLSSKAIEALFDVGVLSLDDLVSTPWTDQEAGRKYASLSWRLSVSALSSPRLISQIEAFRARRLQDLGQA